MERWRRNGGVDKNAVRGGIGVVATVLRGDPGTKRLAELSGPGMTEDGTYGGTPERPDRGRWIGLNGKTMRWGRASKCGVATPERRDEMGAGGVGNFREARDLKIQATKVE